MESEDFINCNNILLIDVFYLFEGTLMAKEKYVLSSGQTGVTLRQKQIIGKAQIINFYFVFGMLFYHFCFTYYTYVSC